MLILLDNYLLLNILCYLDNNITCCGDNSLKKFSFLSKKFYQIILSNKKKLNIRFLVYKLNNRQKKYFRLDKICFGCCYNYKKELLILLANIKYNKINKKKIIFETDNKLIKSKYFHFNNNKDCSDFINYLSKF